MRDDVGQLLWVGFPSTTVPPALAAKLDAGQVGATILFQAQPHDRDQCGLGRQPGGL
ncbi:MAG: hypothetical protein IPQ07_06105 [Myxococcales bacterium]|nr:hypothetical protein [Myxococcales bacterium]